MKKKSRKIAIFHFFWKIFAPLEAKMMKRDKKNEKMIKKMKKLKETCNFPFFGTCVHHWKQK